eukprot:TRINITY_DN8852_c1_g1_i1.p1 TRINITY_DN8852_c1_g1~~TRINITY_DN8852_c1_g1_i1.p1  ORF type:complete len:246 (+),score=87.33 TRINITY_DN8852_c1_g1_i1:280-1017(+)
MSAQRAKRPKKHPPLKALDTAPVRNTITVTRLTDAERVQLQAQAQQPAEAMSQIRPWLYLGSLGDALDRELLRQQGVTHVLNAARECDSGEDPTPGSGSSPEYKKLDLVDNSDEPIVGVFEEAFEFITRARESGGKALVHCRRGISRSATLVIAYLMKSERLGLEEAFEQVRRARSIINPNFGFVLTLESFQRQLPRPVHQEISEAEAAADFSKGVSPSTGFGCFDQLHNPGLRCSGWWQAAAPC